MKRKIAVLLMVAMIVVSNSMVFAVNQGNGDKLQDRQRLQDKTCVVTSIRQCTGECTQDMIRIRDMQKTQDMLKIQDMLRIRDRLRIKSYLTVQDQLRLHEHIYLHDGTCQLS